jgi:hypothetical protein
MWKSVAALSFFTIGFLQTGDRYGGTFQGAVICEDGIVVASDSRTTFMDASGQAFGYVDGMRKIFVERGAAVAVSGLTSLEGELFSSFVRRNDYLLGRPVNEILFGFLLWLPFQNTEAVGLISAGFIDGKPMICSKSPIVPQKCLDSGLISSKGSSLLRDWLLKLGHPPKASEAATALKSAIEEAARTDRTVGGPISVLRLTENGAPQWLENPLTDSGLTHICDLVRQHRTGVRRIMATGSQQELERHLDAACPR